MWRRSLGDTQRVSYRILSWGGGSHDLCFFEVQIAGGMPRPPPKKSFESCCINNICSCFNTKIMIVCLKFGGGGGGGGGLRLGGVSPPFSLLRWSRSPLNLLPNTSAQVTVFAQGVEYPSPQWYTCLGGFTSESLPMQAPPFSNPGCPCTTTVNSG